MTERKQVLMAYDPRTFECTALAPQGDTDAMRKWDALGWRYQVMDADVANARYTRDNPHVESEDERKRRSF